MKARKNLKNLYKIFVWILPILLFAILGCEKTSEESSQIRKRMHDFVDAFNSQDGEKIASLWTSEGTYSNLTTQDVLTGRENIQEFFKEKFSEEGHSTLTISDQSVHISKQNTLDKGIFVITYSDKESEQKAFKINYVNEKGSWLIEKFVEISIQKAPTNYEQLKNLDWLIGDWIDKEENQTLSITYSWDKNKNFMVQEFFMKILDYKDLEGQQFIGWNPSDETVFSWVFDSDGGYGKGIWFEQEGKWYASMDFTLPDGRKASATHVYIKIDENSYSFSSESRDVDGKILPDVGPIVLKRKLSVNS